MEPAYGDRVFVADLSAERPRLGEANVVRFGGRPAADGAGLEATNLQCSLSRRRIVFAATRRLRVLRLEGKRIGGAAAASIGMRKGSSAGETASIAGPEFASA